MHDAAGLRSARSRHPARHRQRQLFMAARGDLAGYGRFRQRDLREPAIAVRNRLAIGLTENDGVAALAGTVGYVVFLAALGLCAKLLGIETKPIMGIDSIETGAFGGICVGLIAAWAFNRFYRLQLPSYLGFFAGKRSVPIITSFAVIALGGVPSFVGPAGGVVIRRFSDWAVHGSPAVAFAIYGVVERSLLPFGLHHVWNVPFFF